jgi:hypothetical protein
MLRRVEPCSAGYLTPYSLHHAGARIEQPVVTHRLQAPRPTRPPRFRAATVGNDFADHGAFTSHSERAMSYPASPTAPVISYAGQSATKLLNLMCNSFDGLDRRIRTTFELARNPPTHQR